MTLGEARQIAGTLSFPTKMPGTSYALPATACLAGSKLAKLRGTVCSVCYALPSRRGNYRIANAIKAMRRRLEALTDPRWVEAMVRLLRHYHSKDKIKVDRGQAGVRAQTTANPGARWFWNDPGFHRWHDSGDLQSVDHLRKICVVALNTPKIKHWLPTQELRIVQTYIELGGTVPANMVIRVSSVFIDDARRRAWPQTSSVIRASTPQGAHICPAPKQEHRCGKCRACWSKDVAHVTYELH